MKPAENNQPVSRSVISQFQDAQETKKVWQDPDKTKPDEEVQKPYANPNEKSENDSSNGQIPKPQTKIGFKTPAEQQEQEKSEQKK